VTQENGDTFTDIYQAEMCNRKYLDIKLEGTCPKSAGFLAFLAENLPNFVHSTQQISGKLLRFVGD
jgi:hypothetical protein